MTPKYVPAFITEHKQLHSKVIRNYIGDLSAENCTNDGDITEAQT